MKRRAAPSLVFLVELCRLLAVACLLAAVLVFFRLPLSVLAAKAGQMGNPLAGLLGPADGFFARVHSTPSGAKIRVDGKERGETPFFGNVECSAGDKVVIEVDLAGFEIWRRELECRENGQLEVDAKLKRR